MIRAGNRVRPMFARESGGSVALSWPRSERTVRCRRPARRSSPQHCRSGSINRALRGIVEAQANAGDIHGAVFTARSINDASSRAWALLDIAEAPLEAASVRPESGAGATTRAAASTVSTIRTIDNAKEYWGAFVSTPGHAKYRPGYGVSWNHPSRESAVAGAAERCGKEAGYPGPCDPASELLYKFSTSAPYQDDYNFQARCFAVAEYTNSDNSISSYGGEPGVSAKDAERNLKPEWA